MKKLITVFTIVLVIALVGVLVACDGLFGKTPSNNTGTNTNNGSQTGDNSGNNSGNNSGTGTNSGNTDTPATPVDTAHETKTINFDNGKYEGQVLKGTNTLDGEGTLTLYYAEGNEVYSGGWSNNMRSGQGTRRYVNGDVYVGGWQNDLEHGKGKYTWADGDYYDGDWVLGDKSGKGTFSYQSGDVVTYEGDVVNNVLTGKATVTYRNQNVYTGDVKDGKRDGTGEMAFADGTSYTGAWRNDYENGLGTRTIKTADGIDTITGDWALGSVSSVGTYVYVWANGERYEGTYAGGQPNGQGTKQYLAKDAEGVVIKDEEGNSLFNTFTGRFAAGAIANQENGEYRWYNGDVYTGGFAGGVQNGAGTLAYANGDSYEGNFVSGVISGQGRFTWVSGDMYTGAFAGGVPNGQGTKNYKKEGGYDVFVGVFAAGEIADQAEGTYTWVSGDTYVGSFRNGLPGGQGAKNFVAKDSAGNVLVDGEGNTLYDTFTGTFVQGELGNTGKMVWHDGYVYDGSWSAGKKNGAGVYYDTLGEVYVGNWAMDVKQGTGTLAKRIAGIEDYTIVYAADWEDEDYEIVYAGTWYEDRKVNGTFFYQTEDETKYKYLGEFNAAGQKEGEGTLYVYASGTYDTQLYTGTWVRDRYFTGTGTYSDEDETFVGEFYEGVRKQGVLTYTIEDASYKYEGAFNAVGEKDGEGDLYLYDEGEETYKDFFKGIWAANVPYTGTGHVDYAEGDYYVGSIVAGLRDGEGAYYYSDGDYYEGNWSAGQKSGSGAYTWANGDKYIGNWVDNMKSGEGKINYQSGAVFQGTFESDESVSGTYTYSTNGVKYQYNGAFSAGMKNGAGTLYLYNDGTQAYDVKQYEGNWVNDQMDGQGKYYFESGDYYDGNWKADKKNGQGTYYYAATEQYYVGGWQADKKQGSGDLTYRKAGEDGYRLIYTGAWVNDKKDGTGRYNYSATEYFVGTWAEDLKANGTYHYESGDVYVGGFDANGKKDGDDATYTWTDGRVFAGSYSSDNMVSGTYTYNQGDDWYRYEGDFVSNLKEDSDAKWYKEVAEEYVLLYEGGFEADNLSGYGVYYYGDDERYAGGWLENKKNGVGVYYNGEDVYLGNWAGDNRSGHGIQAKRIAGEESFSLTYSEGWTDVNYQIVYRGNWASDKKNGNGEYYYTDNDDDYKYVGLFSAGVMDGGGILYRFKDGGGYDVVFNGSYSDGRFLSGTYYYTAGGIDYTYVGDFNANGQKHSDSATLTYTNGGVTYKFEGRFANDNPVEAEGQYYRLEDNDWVPLA